MLQSADRMYQRMVMVHTAGLQIAIHSIGDASNRICVDLYERLLNEYPRADHRHRLEHASQLDAELIADIARLNLVVATQPLFIHSEKAWLEKRLGKDRTGWAAAALLTLLGVPEETVMEDYLRSNDNIIPMYQHVIDAFVAAGGQERIPLGALGVREEYLEAAFEEMRTNYGTIEDYFAEALGIDAEQQQAIRDLYLVRE